MKTTALALLATLLGVSVTPTEAGAAIPSAGLRQAIESGAAVPVADSTLRGGARVLLAQYGGGNDDDDDTPAQRTPQQHRNNRGGGVNLNGIINGIGTIIEMNRRNQQQRQQQQQQQQIYNEQQRRQRAAHDQERKQRAAEQKRRRAEEERLRKLRAEQKKLEELRRHNANQPQPQPAPYQPPTVAPNPPPYVPPQPVVPVVDPNPVPSDDACPDNFQQLKVGQTVLSPYRTDFPADPRVCSGTTRNGCYLRVMNGPAACGSKPTCVMHCPPNVPVLVPKPNPVPVQPACAYPPCAPQPQPVVPTPQPVVPAPQPVPRDDACAYPPCAPQPQPVVPEPVPPPLPPRPPEQPVCATPNCAPVPPVPPPVACANPPCAPVPPPVPCASPPCGPSDQPKPQPTAPEWTLRADPKTEPQPKPTPPEKTVIAEPKTEPQPKPTPPEKTVIAEPKTEPQPKPTPPEKTVSAQPKTEPEHPKTPAEKTIVAQPKTELERPKTPPEKTVTADPKIEPEHPKTTPERTVHADPKTEPDHPTTPERTIIPASLTEPDHPNTPSKKPDFSFDDATPPAPDVNGKACTPTGGIPQPQLALSSNYGRKAVLGALGAIPDAGGPLKALVDALWTDNSTENALKELKAYVDRLVPEALTQDRLTEMENRLGGIKENLDRYYDMDGSEKGSDLLTTLSTITTHSRDFVADNGANKAAPDRTVGYFVEFGLLKLGVLKERLEKDKELFPETDAKKYAHDHAEREKQLNDAIRLLVKRAGELRKALMDRRLDKLRVDHWQTHHVTHGGSGVHNHYRARDDFCDWDGDEEAGDRMGQSAEDKAGQTLKQRHKDVERDYGVAVDAILKPILDWKQRLPEEIERARQEAELERLRYVKAQEFLRKQQEYRANAKPIEGCSYCEEHGIFGID